MNKQFIKGLFVGLIAPIVAFVIYGNQQTRNQLKN